MHIVREAVALLALQPDIKAGSKLPVLVQIWDEIFKHLPRSLLSSPLLIRILSAYLRLTTKVTMNNYWYDFYDEGANVSPQANQQPAVFPNNPFVALPMSSHHARAPGFNANVNGQCYPAAMSNMKQGQS